MTTDSIPLKVRHYSTILLDMTTTVSHKKTGVPVIQLSDDARGSIFFDLFNPFAVQPCRFRFLDVSCFFWIPNEKIKLESSKKSLMCCHFSKSPSSFFSSGNLVVHSSSQKLNQHSSPSRSVERKKLCWICQPTVSHKKSGVTVQFCWI